jgi:rhodanese-related sulfurtransferase
LVAADYLHHVGFRHARSLAGGMIAWAAAGQPIVW